MCGIFGWIGGSPQYSDWLYSQHSAMLRHRGPDDAGFERGAGWGFGFRRLSILDLSPRGHQPMSTDNGRYWIVFNGEIYNYIEIRKKLEKKGEFFTSKSDTEVLLKLLAREGYRGLSLLNGMYSFVFIDTLERRFIIARDRLGQKPLYYSFVNGQLRFSSELKILISWPDATRDLDLDAVMVYMSLGYLPSDYCIFSSYHKLPPGTYLAGSLDSPEQATPHSYWDLKINRTFGEGKISQTELEDLVELINDSIRIRMRSDVPVGVFLSGGIDSGVVAALSAGLEDTRDLLGLTISFSEQGFNEEILAESTAKHLGLDHRIIHQSLGGLSDVDRLAWFFDEPFGDASALPTMTLCDAASKYATVFLSGDGGDEAFGGYERYLKAQKFSFVGRFPSLFRGGLKFLAMCYPLYSNAKYRMLRASLADFGMAAVFDGQGFSTDPVLEKILPDHLKDRIKIGGNPVWDRWESSKDASLLSRQQSLDYDMYLPDDILVKVDRASMAHSIEVRSPFLDHRVVEWVGRLPRAKLIGNEFGKIPLRAIGSKLLPSDVQIGKKMGFGVPLNSWFREEKGLMFVRERLFSPEAKKRGLWETLEVEKLLDSHVGGRGRNFGQLIWQLLVLDAWSRLYLDGSDFLQGVPSK